MPFGYREAKDEKDDLDAEIAARFKRNDPKDTILFDDSTHAVWIQNGSRFPSATRKWFDFAP